VKFSSTEQSYTLWSHQFRQECALPHCFCLQGEKARYPHSLTAGGMPQSACCCRFVGDFKLFSVLAQQQQPRSAHITAKYRQQQSPAVATFPPLRPHLAAPLTNTHAPRLAASLSRTPGQSQRSRPARTRLTMTQFPKRNVNKFDLEKRVFVL